jgi:hypothetical protein
MGWREEIRERIAELEQQRLRLEEHRRRARRLGGPEGQRLETELRAKLLESGALADARVPKHPVARSTIPRLADQGCRPESATGQSLKIVHGRFSEVRLETA